MPLKSQYLFNIYWLIYWLPLDFSSLRSVTMTQQVTLSFHQATARTSKIWHNDDDQDTLLLYIHYILQRLLVIIIKFIWYFGCASSNEWRGAVVGVHWPRRYISACWCWNCAMVHLYHHDNIWQTWMFLCCMRCILYWML